ncbi:hypothetical protein FRC01_009995 [Tulasnella sp. 417]|nr:hypothetical protein FRC01_009995 [Tulasnella sp. 417]
MKPAKLEFSFYDAEEQREYENKRIQRECHKDFKSFSETVQKFNFSVEAFIRAIHPLGSSSRLIRASTDLQDRMNDVLNLFKSNSAQIWKAFQGAGIGSNELPSDLEVSLGPAPTSATELLPCTMYNLWEGLKTLIGHLSEIPQVLDKRLTGALCRFQEWIIFRAMCIMTHWGGSQAEAVSGAEYLLNFISDASSVQALTICQYAVQVMKEMSGHISALTAALSDFTGDGVAVIRGFQEKVQTRLQNMSTMCIHSREGDFPLRGDGNCDTVWPEEGRGHYNGIMDFVAHPKPCFGYQLAVGYTIDNVYLRIAAMGTVSPVWKWIGSELTPLIFLVLAVLAFLAGLLTWTMTSELDRVVKFCVGATAVAAWAVLLAVFLWDGMKWLNEKPISVKQAPIHPDSSQDMKDLRDTWQKWKRQRESEAEQPAVPRKDFCPIISLRGILMAICFGNFSGPQKRLAKLFRKFIIINRLRKPVNPVPLLPEKLYPLHPAHRLKIFHPDGYDISFSPNGKFLAVGGLNGRVAIWTVDKFGQEPEKVIRPGVYARPTRFTWSPDGSRLLTAVMDELTILDTNSWSILVTTKIQHATVITWLQSPNHIIVVVDDVPYIHARNFTYMECSILPISYVLVLGTAKDGTVGGVKAKRPSNAAAERWLMRQSI